MSMTPNAEVPNPLFGKKFWIGPFTESNHWLESSFQDTIAQWVPGLSQNADEQTFTAQKPDALFVILGDAPIPQTFFSFPGPRVGLVRDARTAWHRIRRLLPFCDLVLAEGQDTETIRQTGYLHGMTASQVRLLTRMDSISSNQKELDQQVVRDLDVLAIGWSHTSCEKSAATVLRSLLRMPKEVHIQVCSGTDTKNWQQQLPRAKTVLIAEQGALAGEIAFCAAQHGCLVLLETDELITTPFRDKQSAIGYTRENVASAIRYFIDNPADQAKIAAAGQSVTRDRTPSNLLKHLEQLLANEWYSIQNRAAARFSIAKLDHGKVWVRELLHTHKKVTKEDWSKLASTESQLEISLLQSIDSVREAVDEQSLILLKQVAGASSSKVTTWLNLAETLAHLDKHEDAIAAARIGLTQTIRLRELGPIDRDPPWVRFLPQEFVRQWEAVGFDTVGNRGVESNRKLALLKWRFHSLLCELTNELTHAYEAQFAWPEDAKTPAQLGSILFRNGRVVEALPHLQKALIEQPMLLSCARDLYHALGAVGDAVDQRLLSTDYRRLSEIAPLFCPAEAWFENAIPMEEELTSIVIPCCNQLPYTRSCLESVLRHTESPFELILIDNGSTDGTREFLEDVRSRPGPARVVLIHNGSNRGHPSACNQGILAARGKYVVLLNNDTLVSAGWLPSLLAHLTSSTNPVGLVGAISNHAVSPQWVATNYEDATGLAAFAEHRRTTFAKQSIPASRLSGFCLLSTRELLLKMEGLDERFGLGLYDDDDLCIRIAEAGYQLVVAEDVFIHHFGSRTFQALGLNVLDCLRANWDVFRAKWGDRHSTEKAVTQTSEPKSQLTAPPPLLVPVLRANVSLTMIVRNEQLNIGACLDTVADLVDEVIVVDTGSQDKTREVAREKGAKVYEFPWVDNFAAARNEALRHATGRWILWLDADDRISSIDRERMRTLFAQLREENAAYVMKVQSAVNESGTAIRQLDQVRLFRNHPYIRWRYRVHEQILPAIGLGGGKPRWTDVVITHTGYTDPGLRRRKLERNTRLLEIEYAEQPGDPFTLFNLGRSYLDMNRYRQALPILQKSLERSEPNLSIVRKLYPLIAQAHWMSANRKAAIQTCTRGLECYPDDAELLYQKALLLREEGQFPEAERHLRRLLQSQPGEYFDMLEVGLRSFKARHLLGSVLREQNRLADAEEQYRQALEENPTYFPAIVSLADLHIACKEWEKAESLLSLLQQDTGSHLDYRILLARICFGQKDYDQAKAILETTILNHPNHLPLRVLLTHVLLEEAQDWEAAENALTAVLNLDPQHKEAQHNLDVLRRKLGKKEPM